MHLQYNDLVIQVGISVKMKKVKR